LWLDGFLGAGVQQNVLLLLYAKRKK